MLNTKMKMENDELFIELEGRLDTLSAPGFDRELEAELPKVKGLTLDFEKLEYISSAGLRTVLAAQQYMEEQGYRDVKVLHVNEMIQDIFDLTGFYDIVDVEP